jgi:hypothetical protein
VKLFKFYRGANKKTVSFADESRYGRQYQCGKTFELLIETEKKLKTHLAVYIFKLLRSRSHNAGTEIQAA